MGRKRSRALAVAGALLTAACSPSQDQERNSNSLQTAAQAITSAASDWLGPSTTGVRFRYTDGWFSTSYRQRVWATDFDADGRTDVVAMTNNGDIYMARSLETAFGEPAYRGNSSMSPLNGFFAPEGSDWERVWLANVAGDARPELIGVEFNGNVWMSQQTLQNIGGIPTYGFWNAPTQITTATYPQSNYYSTSHRAHVHLADVTGDGRQDLVGIDPDGVFKVVHYSGSGTTFNTTVSASNSRYKSAWGWFALTDQDRFWFADINSDSRADLVSVANDGRVYVKLSTGTNFADDTDFVALSPFTTALAPLPDPTPAGFNASDTMLGHSNVRYFDNSTARNSRVWMADMDGDGRKDIVGISPTDAGDGDVWYMRSTSVGSNVAFERRSLLHQSVFQAGRQWFDSSRQRIFVDDVNNDTANGLTYGAADIVGVDPSNGNLWYAPSAREQGYGAGAATYRVLLGPSVPTRNSSLSTASYFSTSYRQRVLLGNFSGDGNKDLVAIRSDGSIQWQPIVPTRVMSATMDSVGNATTASTFTVRFSRPMVATSNRGVTFNACGGGGTSSGPVKVTLKGTGSGNTAVNTCSILWSSDGKTVTFGSYITIPTTGIQTVELSLNSALTDQFGMGVDGDGDGQDGGAMSKRFIFSNKLVVGSGQHSIWAYNTQTPSEMYGPEGATSFPASGYAPWDIPVSSGFQYARTQPINSSSVAAGVNPTPGGTPNPPKVRALVIAGGSGGPNGTADSGPMVFISTDLVGYNSSRLAARIESTFGIPANRVIAGATHAHGTHRQIRPYIGLHADDRHAVHATGHLTSGPIDDPFVEWVDRQALRAVRTALSSLHQSKVNVRTRLLPAGSTQLRGACATCAPLTVTDDDRRMNLVDFVDDEGGANTGRIWGSILNLTMHPILTGIFTTDSNPWIDADFPGYLSMMLQSRQSACPDTNGCAALFFNGAAGSVDPNPATMGSVNSLSMANSLFSALTTGSAPAGLADFTETLDGASISIGRTYGTFNGVAHCKAAAPGGPTPVANPNDSTGSTQLVLEEPRPFFDSVQWELPAASVRIRRSSGLGATDVIQIGALAGEPYHVIQRNFLTAAGNIAQRRAMFFGYALEYDGYLPTEDMAVNHMSRTAYSLRACDWEQGHLSGPVYFDVRESPVYCGGVRQQRCASYSLPGTALPACSAVIPNINTCNVLSPGSALGQAAQALAGLSSLTTATP